MVTSTRFTASIDKAAEIRRLVQLGKDRGLIRGPQDAVAVQKNGEAAAALGQVRSQWMDVDPATAHRWLENNFRNRPLSQDVVLAYARDMQRGVWVPTHQGVAFNDRDELIDGQHRLHAIILSGCTIRMMVTFGLPSKIEGFEMTTMDAVDRGRTRSVADQLKIQHGMKDGSIIAAIAASLATLCSAQRTRRLSVGQTLEIYRAFEEPVDFVIAHRVRTIGLRAVGVLAAFVFALGPERDIMENPPAIARMFQRLMSGEGLRDRSPLAALRAFLVSEDAKLLSRQTDRGLAELVLHAVNLELAGASVDTLEMSTAGVETFRAAQAERVNKIAELFRLPERA